MKVNEMKGVSFLFSTVWRYDAPTALSNFLSQRSLIVQPAPRIMRAPVPNKLRYVSGVVQGV